MPEQRFPEWRSQNSTTKYPFSDGASLVNDEGYTLLEGTFLDASVFPVGAREQLHLSLVTVEPDLVTLAIGDRYVAALATATFPLITPDPVVAFADPYGRPAGLLVSTAERMGVFQSWEVGDHPFTPAQSEFAATVCFPSPEGGLRGVLLEDGSFFAGDVWLVGDDGVVLREDTVSIDPGCAPRPYRVVRVDVVGDPLFRRRLCQPAALFQTPRFVKRVYVVHSLGSFTCVPDAGGDVKLTTANHLANDAALRVRTTGDGVGFEVAGRADF
jgi:hypothetical protein